MAEYEQYKHKSAVNGLKEFRIGSEYWIYSGMNFYVTGSSTKSKNKAPI